MQEADRLYTAILKAQPKHPDANHNIAVLAVGVGKVQEALPFFKTALKANPAKAQFWLSYINTLIKLERFTDARVMFKQAKSKGVMGYGFDKLEKKFFQTAQADSPLNSSSVFDTAIELRETGKFEEAIDFLKDGITQFPKDANMIALLSHCLILNDNLKEATLLLDKAKSFDPNNASVGWNEVRLLLKNQSVAEAVSVARRTNIEFPDNVEGMGVLESCLRVSNDISENLVYLDKAIELNPNHAEALINRGLIRLSQKDKANALKDLKKTHKIKPHIKQIWDLVTGLNIEAEQYSEAIFLLIDMIEHDPSHEKSFTLITACNQKANDSALAVKSFKRVLEGKPGDASMHVNLGIALKQQGETYTAIDNFNKALAIKPDYAEAIENSLTLKAQLQGTALTTHIYPTQLVKI